MHAVRKYLEQWAEPEVGFAPFLDGLYERALVVPACAESPDLLDGYTSATQTSKGRTLLVLVVNGPDEAEEPVHEANQTLLSGIRDKLKRVREVEGPAVAFLGTLPLANLDVLVLDRASAGARVPAKEGVGLARKIGTDLALSLHVAGKVRSPYIFATDADVTLPETHLDVPELDPEPPAAALVFPFWHEAGAEPRVNRATALYELSLRYYVAGLGWAGSPYAFHTLGSAVAVSAEAYAAVRGYPKRPAAEDFYLLNKIAKVGRVVRLPRSPVKIRSRASGRTPFGTGAATLRALGGEEQKFHAVACFVVVRDVIALFDAFALNADVPALLDGVRALPDRRRKVIERVLQELDAEKVLGTLSEEAKTAEARRVRVHTWFDAFRTMKLVHAVREEVAPDIAVDQALSAAPFSPVRGAEDASELVTARYAFARAEAATPMLLGPNR